MNEENTHTNSVENNERDHTSDALNENAPRIKLGAFGPPPLPNMETRHNVINSMHSLIDERIAHTLPAEEIKNLARQEIENSIVRLFETRIDKAVQTAMAELKDDVMLVDDFETMLFDNTSAIESIMTDSYDFKTEYDIEEMIEKANEDTANVLDELKSDFVDLNSRHVALCERLKNETFEEEITELQEQYNAIDLDAFEEHMRNYTHEKTSALQNQINDNSADFADAMSNIDKRFEHERKIVDADNTFHESTRQSLLALGERFTDCAKLIADHLSQTKTQNKNTNESTNHNG